MATTFRCPICRRPLPALPGGEPFSPPPHRPFCSERCKTIDLGGWLTGAYRISRPVEEEDLDESVVRGAEDERRH